MTAPRPVFVHGSGGGRFTWDATQRRFEGCLPLCLPGHPDGAPLATAGALGAWLAHEIARIPGPRVLVGHSLGGAAALEAALQAPDLVDGLVLVATGARLPVPDHAFQRARTDLRAECERVVRASFVRQDPEVIAAAVERMAACGAQTLLADYAACDATDLRDRLADVEVPALVVSGAEDPLTPAWMGEELAAGLPRARLVVVPAASHAVMVEAAETVDLAIAAFLALLEVDEDPFPPA
ncbi:MAG: alpha/beta hydrolase [Actinomycetota bacterium]